MRGSDEPCGKDFSGIRYDSLRITLSPILRKFLLNFVEFRFSFPLVVQKIKYYLHFHQMAAANVCGK